MLARGFNLKRAAVKTTASSPVTKDQGDPWASPPHRRDVRAPLLQDDAPNQQRKGIGRGDETTESSARGRRQGPHTDTVPPPGPMQSLPPLLPPSPEAQPQTASRQEPISGCCWDARLARRRRKRKSRCVRRRNEAGRRRGKHAPLTR